jgi:PAS domain S-box-containing protein
MAKSDPNPFRWQLIFERAAEPLFVLDRRRRVLFVNRAFEELTGLSAEQSHGLRCVRCGRPENGLEAVVAAALAPPAEVVEGQSRSSVRFVTAADGSRWHWRVEFFPLSGPQGVRWFMGKIRAAALGPGHASTPLPEEVLALRQGVAERHSLESLTSNYPSMRRLVSQARLAIHSSAPVLLIGEPGSGKRWLARAIHEGARTSDRTFAALDCARLPATALAEALFADSGFARRTGSQTLYLAEPASLALDLQARVCEWLARQTDSRPAADDRSEAGNVRVIAGCSHDPRDDVRGGRLQEDLLCELSTITLSLPPLRERPGDLPNLVGTLLASTAVASEQARQLSARACELLQAHAWPGNFRELKSVLASARQRAAGRSIDVGDLPAYLRRGPAPMPAEAPNLPLDQLLERVERRLIVQALQLARGNKSRAAEILAVWRPRLHRRMEALGLAPPGSEPNASTPVADGEGIKPAADDSLSE